MQEESDEMVSIVGMDICRCTVQELISFSFTREWSPGAHESGDQHWRIVGNTGVLDYHLEYRWRV